MLTILPLRNIPLRSPLILAEHFLPASNVLTLYGNQPEALVDLVIELRILPPVD